MGAKLVPVKHFESCATEGLGILCGIQFFPAGRYEIGKLPPSALRLGKTFYEEYGCGNCFLFPDYSTLRMLPWSGNNVARVICDFKAMKSGMWERIPTARDICQALLLRLKEKHGFELCSAFEHEFMLMKPSDKQAGWEPMWPKHQLLRSLYLGKHEDFLWRHVDGKRENAFHDDSKEDGISDTMRYWTAGLMEHGQALCALVCPTPACYGRLHTSIPGLFVEHSTYGIENRLATCRWKNSSPSSTYVEYRVPSGSSNPYLVIASVLAAGMDGLEKGAANDDLLKKCHFPRGAKKSDLETPENGGPKMFPKCLDDAIACLDADDVIKSAIGEEFLELWKMVKETEIFALDTKFQDKCSKSARAQAAREIYMESL